ncbi:hypothetical protein H9645_00155 [Luteimonas sp. Sa2BVA3]|uniref:Uncharacterized protein n=1 Tax=Luteimonas colneyensis TaxID=2762230 RepID=A0ABR8UEI7_9GAMM|nr:hypothetical protein [Luteimonas colneyensis]MBD7986440.1 hypothetical protein [Luteimonas colneyensis]
MHAILDILPLPASQPARARRHRIAGFEPGERSLARFRSVARALASSDEIPTLDGIASASRSLARAYAGHPLAPCIRQRSRCLRAVRMLAREPGWRLAPAQVERIALLTDYARGHERLVPDAVPVVGGLDTAVLFDIAWPALAADVEAYFDFRRLRTEEALLRGERPRSFPFGRDEWLEARCAEIALRAHVAMRGAETYVHPGAAPLFRVH